LKGVSRGASGAKWVQHAQAWGAAVMEFRVLGPLEVVDGDRHIELGAPQQRSLLAVLVIHANEVVSVDRLMDALWGERPPESAAAVVQVYVSNLRKVLEPNRAPKASADVLSTARPGYVLRVADGSLDVDR